jgi:hypothetical protein
MWLRVYSSVKKSSSSALAANTAWWKKRMSPPAQKSAKRLLLSHAADGHRRPPRVLTPGPQTADQRPDHRQLLRIEGARTVQGDEPDQPTRFGHDFRTSKRGFTHR